MASNEQVIAQLHAARAAIDAALDLMVAENIVMPPSYRARPSNCKHEHALRSMGGWMQCPDCFAQWQEKG